MATSMTDWLGEELIIRRDRSTGAWTIIAVHSTARGPAVGGTRMRTYATPEAAVVDALRLSEGMTMKNAVAALPRGGGKAVIAVPAGLSDVDRTRLLLAHADIVESLGGRFETGPDMGTAEADMDLMGMRTTHVFCRSRAAGGSGTASPWTAAGVFSGIAASVRHALGRTGLAGTTVLVQGVGEVGEKLSRQLHAAGARLLLSDVDAARVANLAAELPGAVVIDPAVVYDTACDVYSPCAVGGTLSSESIPRLRCRIVAGAANNQLAVVHDADLLRDRGILYAPDFVINAGGIIRGVGAETLHWSDAEIDRRVEAIGDALLEIYRDADTNGVSTAAASARLAEERLLAAAGER